MVLSKSPVTYQVTIFFIILQFGALLKTYVLVYVLVLAHISLHAAGVRAGSRDGNLGSHVARSTKKGGVWAGTIWL